MTHPRSVLAALATLAIVAVSLSGCARPSAPSASAPASKSASAEPSASPKPKPAPVTASKIDIDRLGITVVGSNGSPLDRVLYTSDPVTAISLLTTHLGSPPTLESFPAGECSVAKKQAKWGDALSLTYPTDASSDPAQTFFVRSDAPISGKVRLETPKGFAVGDPVKAMITATPGVVTQGEENPGAFGIRVFYDLDADQNAAFLDSDPKTLLISIIAAPGNVNQDC